MAKRVGPASLGEAINPIQILTTRVDCYNITGKIEVSNNKFVVNSIQYTIASQAFDEQELDWVVIAEGSDGKTRSFIMVPAVTIPQTQQPGFWEIIGMSDPLRT